MAAARPVPRYLFVLLSNIEHLRISCSIITHPSANRQVVLLAQLLVVVGFIGVRTPDTLHLLLSGLHTGNLCSSFGVICGSLCFVYLFPSLRGSGCENSSNPGFVVCIGLRVAFVVPIRVPHHDPFVVVVVVHILLDL
jgi:hypothetical protein